MDYDNLPNTKDSTGRSPRVYLAETPFNAGPEHFYVEVAFEGVIVDAPSVRDTMDWPVVEKLYEALGRALKDWKRAGLIPVTRPMTAEDRMS